jgi:pyruvate,water dikinase
MSMTIIKTAKLKWLNQLDTVNDAAGGKAQGLQRLMQWGLDVPNGFAIVNAEQGVDADELAKFYQQLGAGKVAVRSSALAEDGSEHSFAGLYETLLNIEGIAALEQAVTDCVASLDSARAKAYQQQQGFDEQHMCVVVQTMVDASVAGVLFSADPVSGRHDRIIIDAVSGLGEALVSGDVTPDHYEYDPNHKLCYQEWVNEEALLTEAMSEQLLKGARLAVEKAGEPLDMEWAIDKEGKLLWLQARPITTLGSDLKELDTAFNAEDVLTRCNIGEMMPGACCPLTFSTTGRGIEYGMQHMHVSYASRPAITNEWTQVAMSSGQLFINLTGAAAAASTVIGVDVKALGLSVCGRVVDELAEPKKKCSIFTRIGGMVKLLSYLRHADAVIDDFTKRVDTFQLAKNGSSTNQALALDKALDVLNEAFAVHLQSSTTSGFASNVLQSIISGGQESSAEEEAEAAKLMAGATGVESAVLVEQLDAVVDAIAKHAQAKTQFVDVEPKQAQVWLESDSSGCADLFQAFLQRHGHRSYRELCVRERCWEDNPEQLMSTMQASVTARLQGVTASAKPVTVNLAELNRGLRWILPKAHNAIRRREKTKSLLVDITNRIKRGYRALAEQLVAEAKLSDADLLFFFTHDELMYFVNDHLSDIELSVWNQRLEKRRLALSFQDRLQFADISVGTPEPIDYRSQANNAGLEGKLVGRPVSRGVVEAPARVAFTVAEAAQLKPGEILVAPITDVGWTPFFSMISGLITDVGSAVSHGAVIAREYGLPAIVNTGFATQKIKTGDTLRLDADSGVITVLDDNNEDIEVTK